MKTHILTIAVEDYFHVAALRAAVRPKHWERLEPRLDRNLDEVLLLLERYGQRATFFVFGWVAEQQPELVRRIASAGQEIASRGFRPRELASLEREEFRADLRAAQSALERAGANRIVGYRAPRWLHESESWILDVLADEGYQYDSSVNPILRRFSGAPEMFDIHRHVHAGGGRSIWEFPISTVSLFGMRLAISGGNYIRQLPHTLLSRVVDAKSRQTVDPLVFYFMPWELDRHQPRVQGISTLQRIRHYRNLSKTRWVLDDYFHRYSFIGIGDYLDLPLDAPKKVVATEAPATVAEPVELAAAGGDHATALPIEGSEIRPVQAVTLVVPMFNESTNVIYLRRTLTAFRRRLERRYRVHLMLVDDGSSDGTEARLREEFAGAPECTILTHDRNRGVAAAILTGIRAAPTEIVCSIDCDCSYDPQEFEAIIPKIESADLVTASPYHPDGAVLHVPAWRLLLSKTLSRMYSAVLSDRFHTFTSCCRVYRKSAVAGYELDNGGFLGVAELLIRMKLDGKRIVEHPATLESRLFGESKMKVARTIGSHLGLLQRLVGRRALGDGSETLGAAR